jgi:hypothetical protein
MPLPPLNGRVAKGSTPRRVGQRRGISGRGGGREIPRTVGDLRTVVESRLAQEEVDHLPHGGGVIAHQRTPFETFSAVPPALIAERTRAMMRRLDQVIAGVEYRVPWDLHHGAGHV